MPFLNRSKKLTCEICGTRTRRNNIQQPVGDIQWEPCTALNDQIFLQPLKFTRIFVLPRRKAQPRQRIFSSFTLAIKILPVPIPCDYTDQNIFKVKVDPKQETLTLNIYWEICMTIASGKRCKHANTSSVTLSWSTGDMECSCLQVFRWTHTSYIKSLIWCFIVSNEQVKRIRLLVLFPKI